MMDETERQRRVLKGAISHMRCVLSERHQTTESRRIAQENIAKYEARLNNLRD